MILEYPLNTFFDDPIKNFKSFWLLLLSVDVTHLSNKRSNILDIHFLTFSMKLLFLVMSCHVMSCHVISCHVKSCHAGIYNGFHCTFKPFERKFFFKFSIKMIHLVMSCHIMSCHVMSCHVMSCHVK